MKITLKRLALGIASAGLLTIYGCGGGNSSATPTTTSGVTTTFSGVAATGKALANATVSISCAVGSGSAPPTKTDGSYSVDIKNITLPCALKAASSDGTTVLYSVTSATATSKNTQVANITPLTQLLVASLTGSEPAAFFSNFSASTASSVTDSAISTAQTAVLGTLSNAGIDVSGLSTTSLVSGPLVAGSPTSPYDVALEALGTKLTSLASTGTTLATLTTTVANTSTTTASTATATSPTPAATSGKASLPADMLLKTAASNCSAMRSGSYRVFSPTSSPSTNYSSLITIDAATGTITYANASKETVTPNGPCRYLGANGKDDIVVSPAGVIVARSTNDGGLSYQLGIGFPQQTHTLAEAVGSWNAIGLSGNGAGVFSGAAFSATIDAAGAVTGSSCGYLGDWNVTSCTPVTAGKLVLKANSDGGFDLMVNGTLGGRMFAYRAGGGELMTVEVDNDGSFSVFTKQRTDGLPTVGAVTTSWNLSLGSQLTSTVVVDANSNTIVSVDTAAGSWLRKQNTVGLNDGHLETLLANNPRAGYSFRAAGTALADNGTTASFREVTSLGLRGMGLNAALVPTAKRFQISVNQP